MFEQELKIAKEIIGKFKKSDKFKTASHITVGQLEFYSDASGGSEYFSIEKDSNKVLITLYYIERKTDLNNPVVNWVSWLTEINESYNPTVISQSVVVDGRTYVLEDKGEE